MIFPIPLALDGTNSSGTNLDSRKAGPAGADSRDGVRNDLDTLIPPTAEITIGGETLALQPLKVGQLPAFLRAIAPAIKQLTTPEIDWLALFGERGDDLLTAIAIAIGKPRGWVNDLAADEALLLAAKVIEVNADFFTRTVIPRLEGLFAQVKNLTPTQAAGSTPSSG